MLKLTLEDCINENDCDVVYQEGRSASLNSVPPGQARDFEILGVGSYDMRLKGSLKWHYELTDVRGRK